MVQLGTINYTAPQATTGISVGLIQVVSSTEPCYGFDLSIKMDMKKGGVLLTPPFVF